MRFSVLVKDKKKKIVLLFAMATVLLLLLYNNILFRIPALTRNDGVVASQANRSRTATSKTIFLVYLVSMDDSYQTSRIVEMQRAFKDNFVVVWGNRDAPDCPFRHIATCVDDLSISKMRLLTGAKSCCAIEKGLTWAIQNKDLFDHVWFMEDDVYYTDISELEQVVNTPSPVDFLYHKEPKRMRNWNVAKRVRRDSKGLIQEQHFMHCLLNLYRLSRTMLTALDVVYEKLDREWFFLEALIPTISSHANLSSALWTQLQGDTKNESSSEYNIRFRPCYHNESLQSPGIYHPTKNRNGIFQSC